MSNELLKNLPSNNESQKVSAIKLPRKKEAIKAGAEIVKNVGWNEVLNIDIGVEKSKEISKSTSKNCIGTIIDINADLKEALNFNVQQGDNQELCINPIENNKVISRNSKLQCNCPKVKNDDFLWNWICVTKVRVWITLQYIIKMFEV